MAWNWGEEEKDKKNEGIMIIEAKGKKREENHREMQSEKMVKNEKEKMKKKKGGGGVGVGMGTKSPKFATVWELNRAPPTGDPQLAKADPKGEDTNWKRRKEGGSAGVRQCWQSHLHPNHPIWPIQAIRPFGFGR
jgi:hypothetical protein